MNYEAADILAEWRAIERDLEDPDLGPPARELLEGKVLQLRDSYQQLVAEQQPQAEAAPSS